VEPASVGVKTREDASRKSATQHQVSKFLRAVDTEPGTGEYTHLLQKKKGRQWL
jgi:hypothetical protein